MLIDVLYECIGKILIKKDLVQQFRRKRSNLIGSISGIILVGSATNLRSVSLISFLNSGSKRDFYKDIKNWDNQERPSRRAL